MDVHPHTSAHAHLLRQVPGGFRARSLHFNSVSNSMVAGPSKVSGVMRTKTRWHFCVGRVPLYLSMDLLLNRVGHKALVAREVKPTQQAQSLLGLVLERSLC